MSRVTAAPGAVITRSTKPRAFSELGPVVLPAPGSTRLATGPWIVNERVVARLPTCAVLSSFTAPASTVTVTSPVAVTAPVVKTRHTPLPSATGSNPLPLARPSPPVMLNFERSMVPMAGVAPPTAAGGVSRRSM